MIGFIVAGLVIGLLARLVRPGPQHLGLPITLAVGLVGSVIGGTIANVVGTGDVFELNVLGFVVAVGSAVLLLGVFERTWRSTSRADETGPSDAVATRGSRR